jgi:glycosyltransferase involved in cell wall biosynthesis
MQTLSIVIPAYNEEKTINGILEKIMHVKLNGVIKQVIIIDDCSKDRTSEIVREFIEQYPDEDIIFINQEVNQGKGAAIHKGIEAATGDFIIIQDADLEYDPREYAHLLKPMLEGHSDVVYGSRFMGHNPHRILFFWHSIGNRFLTFLSNMFTNLNLTDMETCYKLFKAPVLKNLRLKEKRFGFEVEVTARIARIPNIRIYEVGISYYGRTYNEGKKINWKDGLRAIYCILKYNLFLKRQTSQFLNS